jgi:hypothetical protein
MSIGVVLRGYSGQAVKFTAQLNPVPRLGIIGATFLLPVQAFMAGTGTALTSLSSDITHE